MAPPDGTRSDLATQIAAELRKGIFTGEFKPGARLPSETVLSAEFGVSRPTLREALKHLSAQGFIVTRRGARGGAFVTRPNAAALQDQLAEILALAALGQDTGLAEVRAAYAAVLGAALSGVTKDRAALAAAQVALAAAEPATLADRHLDFHLALAGVSQNPVLCLLAGGIARVLGPALSPTRPTTVDCGRIGALCARMTEAMAEGDLDRLARGIGDWYAFLSARG